MFRFSVKSNQLILNIRETQKITSKRELDQKGLIVNSGIGGEFSLPMLNTQVTKN